jgi:hypothetical protein
MNQFLEQIVVGAKVDTKGFKKADTALAKLGGSAKKLAGGLGLALGARAIGIYAKNAVNAFAADDKAAKTLAKTLDNLGSGFANPAVADFIAKLEKQTGVLDDQLRPAYQKLFTTTADWKKSQDLLTTALDLSAQSGVDVVTVSDDLARAYMGNTKGLQKYGLGFTKAELAAADLDTILQRIADISAGQAEVSANSLSGSIDKLQVASANAAETIGKGLSEAFNELSGQNGIGGTTDAIGYFASGISDAIVGTERLIKLVAIFATGGGLKGITDFVKQYQKADMLSRQQYGGIYADKYKNEAQLAADKKAAEYAKAAAAAAKAKAQAEAKALAAKKLSNAIDKANTVLSKGSNVFDLDKIQLAAAEKSQVEQLGKVTNQAQLLAITNDLARLQIKKDIIALEDAIASKDEASITAATNKLNADLKIYGALTNQEIKLTEIKSILDKITPKDLINLDNLYTAIDLLGQINKIPVTGGATTNAGAITSTATADPRTALQKLTSGQSLNAAEASALGVPDYASFNPEMVGMTSKGVAPSSTNLNVTVNTGIGDPNAIAEAVVTVINEAAQRGTLTGTLGVR